MIITLEHNNKTYEVSLSQAINISIPLDDGIQGPICFHSPPYRTAPVIIGDYIGAIDQGSPVNFYTVHLTPHGNGTHTECQGHIDPKFQKINENLTEYHFIGELIEVLPTTHENGDRIITRSQLEELWQNVDDVSVLIIRTLPNSQDKLYRDYTGTNPPYFESQAIEYIVSKGIKHLMTDLPSVDKEEDGGNLFAHKAFWHTIGLNRSDATITELIYVDNIIETGKYFINLQVLNITLDASPSQVLLYPLRERNE